MSQSWAFVIDSVPFTKAVVAGETSLGGSESACLGLARALKQRGHDVHVFATKLSPDAAGVDAAGVTFHPIEHFYPMNQWVEWDVVCALRMPVIYNYRVHARLRLLWNQDMLLPESGKLVMAIAWALDHAVYVSEYHRRQWEDLQPELKPLGWVTKNGYDPAHVPADVTKDPNRIIHISRPERGLAPLLAMWPELKQRAPQATLQICRYDSMYDGEGSNVRAMCEAFDREVARVQQEVGGITYLGGLSKPQLYRAIAEAAVMWYPGIDTFAETSCIAAIEAQACGTPFVGSWKGALPETVPTGTLIVGNAETPEYQQDSIAAVVHMLNGCKDRTFTYLTLRNAGRAHVKDYTYDAIAAEWEAQVEAWFSERYEGNKVRIMRQLLHDDDHTAARVVANSIIANHPSYPPNGGDGTAADLVEAKAAEVFCDRVIAGLEQGAEDYAAHAIQDPLDEVRLSGRFQALPPHFKDCTRVLDIACGNGAGAIVLAMANPNLHIVGLDYAEGNIVSATDAAQRAGVGDRCTFIQATVYDFDRQVMHADWHAFVDALPPADKFDGLFVGEFAEHVANVELLVDALEETLVDGAVAVYTCPSGPFGDLVQRGQAIQRGHVHCFKHDDVKTVWGEKLNCGADFFEIGITPRGGPIGHWIIHYRTAPNRPAGARNLAERAKRTRPMQRLSVGLIVKNGAFDLARCLNSIWNIADEIVVGDTGSRDDTKAIAESFGARVIDVQPVLEQLEGFSGARNDVLQACTGEWFLWIDADEIMVGSHLLRAYLEGPVYQGFVIHQNHVYLDAPPTFDIPVRVFRRVPAIAFYGCVHEQPQMGGPNEDIYPTLQPGDVQIVHTGYLTADIREEKRRGRNLPLLIRDQQVFPERLLGKMLLLREAVVQADEECAHAGGLTVRAQQGYSHAVNLFIQHFDDPSHKFHGIARPWYEAALRHLGLGYEMELGLGGKPASVGGLADKHAKPERIWVRDAAEFGRLVSFQVGRMQQQMVPPAPPKTDPFIHPAVAAEVVSA